MPSLSTPTNTVFRALREIAQALSTAWDLDTTLDLIARQTASALATNSCSIYLLDPHSHTLRLRASTGLARRVLGLATLRLGEGMTGHSAQTRQPIYSANAQAHPHFKWVQGSSEAAFQSLLAVPLLLDQQLFGALNVQTISPHHFTPNEIEFLSLIADLAAGALAKAQLHDNQKRQIAELQALAEVSELATSPTYMDDMLAVVTNMAAQVMDAAVCSIFLLNEANTHLELRSAKHKNTPYSPRPPLQLGQGVIGKVAQTGKPQYIADVRTAPAYLGQNLARQEGLVSLLAVPLSVRERVVGVMGAYTLTERDFAPEQRALFLTLANQTALALENARLATNAAIVREMHHRIKNNLQTVAMLMQIQMAEATHEEAKQVLALSMHRVYSIAAVHEVLSERGFNLVNVKDVLLRLVSMLYGSLTAPQLTLQVDVEGQSLDLSSRVATNVALVVNELVQNALDHAFPGREYAHIIITLTHTTPTIIITVQDNGIGLPTTYQPGLGTEIVTTLIQEELQGQLTYQSSPTGTLVTIQLPRQI